MKKTFAILLAALMLISLTAPAFRADYEDGDECWNCGHYHWDEYMCGNCGACSSECTHTDCYESSHCATCGDCFLNAQVWCEDCLNCESCYIDNLYHCLFCGNCSFSGLDVCTECGACEDCWVAFESHCLYCGECYAGRENEELCKSCLACSECVGEICEYCGDCEDCAGFAKGNHCPECNNCYENIPRCDDGGEHCQECCVICDECGTCYFDTEVELCEYCGLCPYCCENTAQSFDCLCGDYCVMSPEWSDHTCEECGEPFCFVDQCPICELCENCCADNSECSEGMCAEDPDYDDHFCGDCGECFHEVDRCDECYSDGILRCEDCCEAIEAAYASHKATPRSAWSYNSSFHYHGCIYCGSSAHYKDIGTHTFNSNGICTVCYYNSGSKSIITSQPKNQSATVTDVRFEDDDSPLSARNNMVTFSVTARDAKSYQWYYRCDGSRWIALKNETYGSDFYFIRGVRTNTLTVSVPSDACICNYYYRCVVTGNDGKEYVSDSARLIVKHTYDYNFGIEVYGKRYYEFYYPDGTHIPFYETFGHRIACIGECGTFLSDEIQPHVYSPDYRVVTERGGVKWNVYTCKICGYRHFVRQSEDTIKDEIAKTEAKTVRISSVSVTGIDAPKAGSKPDYTGAAGTGYTFKDYGNEYYENGITWYDITDQEDMPVKTAAFKEGHDYKVKIHLTVLQGYAFSDEVSGTISGKVACALIKETQVVLTLTYKYSGGKFVADEMTQEEKLDKNAEKTKEKTESESKEKIKEILEASEITWSKCSDWALEELNRAKASGLIPSIMKDLDLTQQVTRREFAHVAVKLYEKISGVNNVAVGANPFKDTDDPEVVRAYYLGITNGTSATTFDPDSLITREQMATMMTRALKTAGIDTKVDLSKAAKFADDAQMHDWGRESIYFMSNIGIIRGVGNNTFDVLGKATREQALLISVRSAEHFA